MATGQYLMTDVDPPPTGKFSLNDIEENQPPVATEKPGLLQRGWTAANTGLISPETLINAGAALMHKPPDMLPGESVQQYLERGKNTLNPDNPTMAGIRAGLSGAAADTAGLASSLTSPMSIALAGSGQLAKVLPAAGRIAGAARTALKGTELAASLGFGAKGAGDVIGAGLENSPEAWQKRLQGAGQAVAGAAGLTDTAPSFQRAKDWLNSKVYPVVGQNVVNVSRSANTFTDLLNRPIGQMLPAGIKGVLGDFIARMAPNVAPMNFEELHQWTSDVNSYLNSKEGKTIPEKGKAVLRQGMAEARQSLDHSADAGGVKDEWQGFNREYARAIKLNKAANLSGTALGAAAGGTLGFEASSALGIPGPLRYLAASAGATGGGLAGKKVIGGMVESVLNRNPSARLPILAGSVTAPSGAINAIMQMAKDGEISPGEATRRISNLGVSTKVNVPYWKAKTYPNITGEE